MKPFDPLETFLALGMALQNLVRFFPNLRAQVLPFVSQDIVRVNGELQKLGVDIFYKDNKFCVSDGLQRGSRPRIRVHRGLNRELLVMDRVMALVEYARAMTELCRMAITPGTPRDDYYIYARESSEYEAWMNTGCLFFDFPETTFEEREAVAAALNVDVVAFHFGKIFVFFGGGVQKAKHNNTLFVLNWANSPVRLSQSREPEAIFLWTKERMNEEAVLSFLRGLKEPSCWFVGSPMVYRPLTVGHCYLIG